MWVVKSKKIKWAVQIARMERSTYGVLLGKSEGKSVSYKQRYNNPCTGQDRPWGFQELEAPIFQDNRYMKKVSLSALLTGCLYPPGNISGTL